MSDDAAPAPKSNPRAKLPPRPKLGDIRAELPKLRALDLAVQNYFDAVRFEAELPQFGPEGRDHPSDHQAGLFAGQRFEAEYRILAVILECSIKDAPHIHRAPRAIVHRGMLWTAVHDPNDGTPLGERSGASWGIMRAACIPVDSMRNATTFEPWLSVGQDPEPEEETPEEPAEAEEITREEIERIVDETARATRREGPAEAAGVPPKG